MKKIITAILSATMLFTVIGCSNTESNSTSSSSEAKSNDFKIVTSFYPMQILTMNLTKDINNVNLISMSEPNLECIHDHTFTTEDLKMIENADVFVENGLNLEVFNDKITSAYPNTKIIEASKNVTANESSNPHVWTNIDDYIKQIEYVSSMLQSLNPENKDKYSANEKDYVEKLNKLKSDFKDNLSKIEGKKVLVLDETLPPLCTFAKLKTIEIESDHENESISADAIKNTIEEMKKDNVKSIFIKKGSDRKNAEIIAKETEAKIYEFNSCMTGDINIDAYLNDMNENFKIISEIE